MIRKSALAIAVSTLISIPAQAEVYGILKASYLTGVDDFDDEQTFGLVVGYQFSDAHMLELEAQVNGFDSTKPGFEVDADAFTYLLNYHYKFWQGAKWQARAGAGVGFAQAEFGVTADDRGEDDIFVWHVGAGADYSISDKFKLTFDLRLQDFAEMSDDGVSYNIGTPVVLSAGLRYDF